MSIRDKFKASAIHLAISFSVILAFLSIIFFIWYPQPYTGISGISNILLILICVDLILGPLLTFIVFKKGKATLKFDLTVIASIQISALLYGVFTIYEGHPAYVVFAVDRFELIPAQEAEPDNSMHDEFKISKLWLPKLAYAKKPEDPAIKNKLLFEVLSGRPDIERRPEFYEPLNKFSNEIFARAISPNILQAQPKNKQKLDTFLVEHGKTVNDYAFIPLIGKEKDVLWAWDLSTKQPVDTLDINPWKLNKLAVSK